MFYLVGLYPSYKLSNAIYFLLAEQIQKGGFEVEGKISHHNWYTRIWETEKTENWTKWCKFGKSIFINSCYNQIYKLITNIN